MSSPQFLSSEPRQHPDFTDERERKCQLSIVIPAYNEAESIEKLFEEIVAVLSDLDLTYEIVFVDDGSRDGTHAVVETLHLMNQGRVKVIEFQANFGKAAALKAGFEHASGDVIVTMDADLQDVPAEIPKFIEKINEGHDLVSGWKEDRKDPFIKNKTSILFNAVTRYISKVNLHDFNCGFKAYRKEVAKGLNLYGELHRYIPVIAGAQGYRVAEIPVHHRKREFGKTKYGPIRFIHGFLDLLTVIFITRYRVRPLHLFGYLGLGFFSAGFLIAIYLTALKFIWHQPIGDRPLLLFSAMLMIMGVQIGVVGLVGEQITSLIHKTDQTSIIRRILN